MSSLRSSLNPVHRDLDTTSVMAAPGPPGPLMTDEHDGAVNDVSVALTSNNSTAHILDQINPSINPYSLNNDALVKDLGHRVDVEQHGNMNDATTITSSASRRLHNLQLNKHSAHFSDNSDPNIMVDNDDALAEDLAKLINSSEYDKAADTFSTTSPAYPVCDTDQPNKHSKQKAFNPNNKTNDAFITGLANDIDVDHINKRHDVVDNFPVALLNTGSTTHLLQAVRPSNNNPNKIQRKDDEKLKNVLRGIASALNTFTSIDSSAGMPEFKTVLDKTTSPAEPSASSSPQLHPDIYNIQRRITKFQGVHNPAHELVVSA